MKLELKMFTATTNFAPTGPVNWAGVLTSHVVVVVRFVQTVPLGSARACGVTEMINNSPRTITHTENPTLTRFMTLNPLLKGKFSTSGIKCLGLLVFYGLGWISFSF
jgi:hypothetical protein